MKNSDIPHYDIGKYKYPGTGYYVLRNGFIVSSGTLKECNVFIKERKK